MTGLARFPRSWHISNLFKKSRRVHMSGLSGSVPDLNFYRAGSREPMRKFIPYVHSITGMEFFFNYVCHRLGLAECGLRQRGQKWRQVSRFLHPPPTLQTVVPLPQQGGTDGIMVLCLLYFPQHKYPI